MEREPRPGPGQSKLTNSNRGKLFTTEKRDGKTITFVRMRCSKIVCCGIISKEVHPDHVNPDQEVMKANILRDIESNKRSLYLCGTCRRPLVFWAPSIEKRHDTEEL